jgi:YEATS domain-containing protein 4
VHFVPEASEKPMTLFHFLHLHPYGPNKEEERDKGLTVDAYQYEEIVFGDPTEQFFEILTKVPAPPPPVEVTNGNVYSMFSFWGLGDTDGSETEGGRGDCEVG